MKRSRKWILPALLFLSLGGPAWGAGKFVQEVRLEGLKRIPEESVRVQMATQAGRIVGREEINGDVRRLYKLGIFRDIQVDEKRGEHGWIYTFVFSEKPVITKISFEGNKKIKDSQFKETITIPLYQPLAEARLAESVEKMRGLYAKKKYYLAEIDYRLRALAEGNHELVFEIEEHMPALIREVLFVGNTVFDDRALRKVLKTRRKGVFSFVTGSGKFEEEQLRADILRLTFHYLKNGYLRVHVEEPAVSLSKDFRYLFVTFRVTEGGLYRIGKVDVTGDILTTREELLANMLTKSGEIYNREFIERDLQRLTKMYADRGYAFVNIQPVTEADDTALTADLTFHFSKGDRVRIEEINIHGNTVTRDKVLRREMQVQEGDLYNETLIQESRQKLLQLGFFKDVNFATPRGTGEDEITLDVTVEEQPTGSFSLGAGFSTSENFIFTGSLQKQNFFGRGWSGELSAEISSIRQQYLFSMIDPYFLDSEWILGLSSYKTAFQFEGFDRDSVGGSVSIGHRFFDNMSVSFGYQGEGVETLLEPYVPIRFRDPATGDRIVGGTTSLLSLTINRDTRDNRIFANKGSFQSIKSEISDDWLGAENRFYRINGRLQYYFPLGKGFTFKGFARGGYIENVGNDGIQLFDRFFLGGVNSLRGFNPLSVGPREQVTKDGKPATFVFGGTKMAVFNFEMEYPIYEPAGLKFVTFFDTGNTFGEGETFAIDRFRMDWGFGLRWVSPMGPLRFEWGFPINKRPEEQSSVFNFTIGQFF